MVVYNINLLVGCYILVMCSVTFHMVPVYVSRGKALSLLSALYFWATLRCGVFGCHGILV